MSGDTEGDFWRDVREARREERRLHGVDCPGCKVKRPKAFPTILLPGQRCRVCGYTDPRKREET